MGMPVQHYYTPADLLDFPEDGNKYEVVHGELLVTPAPRKLHQRVVGRLSSCSNWHYLRAHPIGEAYPGGDVRWRPRTAWSSPTCWSWTGRAPGTNDWEQMVPPLLVVEVLSPSTAPTGSIHQAAALPGDGRAALLAGGRGAARLVEVWTPDAVFPVVERAALHWQPVGAGDPLVISLPELFREV